jgi:RNA polymerase sigma-70 factor (sigma-E family)
MKTIDAALTLPPAAPPPRVIVGAVDAVDTFEAVFEREYAPMVRLAFLLLDSNEVAEEVVQDAFARLHERWDRVDNPGGYLRTSVVNRARDIQRRRQRERRLPVAAPEAATLGADHLLDALATLPSKRRAALVLRYYDDLSEAEIASVLGVRPGTVKSMLHRGLAQLREVIER